MTQNCLEFRSGDVVYLSVPIPEGWNNCTFTAGIMMGKRPDEIPRHRFWNGRRIVNTVKHKLLGDAGLDTLHSLDGMVPGVYYQVAKTYNNGKSAGVCAVPACKVKPSSPLAVSFVEGSQ